MAELQDLIGQTVVIDLRSSFVCLGVLRGWSDQFLRLQNADIHDLRDSPTTRENYIAEAKLTGIKVNRRELRLAVRDVVAIANFADVVFHEDE
jgi:small nuclear ribonucleoprotein (snRNP)-like protein